MAATLNPFQETVCTGIVARLDNVRELYDRLSQADPARLHEARRNDAALVLQAPTGAGKTLVAVGRCVACLRRSRCCGSGSRRSLALWSSRAG